MAETIFESDLRIAYGHGADACKGASVADGNFVEGSDGYCHEYHDLSGMSAVRMHTYTGKWVPVLSSRDRWHTPAT